MTDLRARLDAHLGDRYEVVRELGAGGMATVFLATDTKHGREVAFKVLRPEVAGAVGPERFLREIETVARLTHPHILPLHDSGEAGGLLYYVMPYVEGESLRERLERDGALPIEEALRITAECAEALEQAHREGIIHRDLKPANILFSGGQPVVADFGIGRAVEDAAEEQALTRTGISLGTVGYMSPEQVSGEGAVDARSDVYALGCVLYEMLTGEHAFPGRTAQAVIARQLTEAPPTVSVLRRGVPEAVERLVQKALQPNRADRYRTAAEFRAELAVAQQAGERPATRAPLGLMRQLAVAGVGLLILSALAYMGLVYAGGGIAEARIPEIRSLAVLPLENLAPDPEAEQYFADGMTEALTSELGQISAFKVIARTSAMRYRDSDKSIPEIAEELGADGLIEGSVLQAGDEVRITLQLVHGPTARHLWSESYEGNLRDILALQGEVARSVAKEIRVTVTRAERARLSEAKLVTPEAYHAYLRGRYFVNRWPAPEARRCVDHLGSAIDRDPTFADAYSALALCYVQMGWESAPRDVFPLAQEAAQEALELDPNQSEAYAALGAANLFHEWDWSAAAQNLRRALEMQPNNSFARISFSNLLVFRGNFEEGIRQATRGVDLDPVSVLTNRNLAFVYQLSRRYRDYAAQARATMELGQSIAAARFDLAWAYALQGRRDEAVAELREGTFGGLLAALVHATVGDEERALKQVGEVIQWRSEQYVDAFWIGLVFVATEDFDEAIRWLNQAYEERSASMVQLKTNPGLDQVRADPRFQNLMRRMDFPEP